MVRRNFCLSQMTKVSEKMVKLIENLSKPEKIENYKKSVNKMQKIHFSSNIYS